MGSPGWMRFWMPSSPAISIDTSDGAEIDPATRAGNEQNRCRRVRPTGGARTLQVAHRLEA
jgi:hypothetical protein